MPSHAAPLLWLFAARVDGLDPSRPLYLDETAPEVPVVATGAAASEAPRLTDVLEGC